MRGKHYLVFDTVAKANAQRRKLSEELNFPPTLAFSHTELKPARPTGQALAEALPANIKLLTLTANYKEINDVSTCTQSSLQLGFQGCLWRD